MAEGQGSQHDTGGFSGSMVLQWGIGISEHCADFLGQAAVGAASEPVFVLPSTALLIQVF